MDKKIKGMHLVTLAEPMTNMEEITLERAGITQGRLLNALWKHTNGDTEAYDEINKLMETIRC